jgi:tetraprenyl-beta-curcumene synthase
MLSSPPLAAVMLSRYWLTIWPLARRELRCWHRLAEAIPDPDLRRLALLTHREERMNAEGAAIFATLAPWRLTPTLVRLLVAYQTLFDYLDTISEQPPARRADTRRLHRALVDALDPGGACADWYGLHGRREDGGYVGALVDACRSAAAVLPAFPRVQAPALAAAARAGEVQALNHGAGDRPASLARWAARYPELAGGLHWWEFAASASSSLTVHAMLALASQPGTNAAQARRAERGYCVLLGALNTLLESLVDLHRDERSGDHSFAGYYPDAHSAGARLDMIAGSARRAASALPAAERQAVILAGMVSFYLSMPEAWLPRSRAASCRTLAAIGDPAPTLIRLLRLRRAL